MKRLSRTLQNASSGWVALLALLMFLVFTATVLPDQARQADEAAAGADSPDMMLWYTPSDLYEMAETYGPEGRQAYIRARFTFDVAWPLVYGFFLVTAISWLFGKGFAKDSPWQLANLVPLAAMALDFLENISTSIVMARYPAETPLIAALAPLFTLLKWVLVGGSMLLVVVGVVAAIVAAVKRRKKYATQV
jgi:hypothetical protein